MDPPLRSPDRVTRTISGSSLTAESDTVNSIPDENIIQTNEEASLCKLDAVKLGYWKDPFLPLMVHGSLRHERKAPEMYKGYYARVKCVERLVLDFIDAVQKSRGAEAVVQIVNLGAGYDTLYWRLHANQALTRQVTIFFREKDVFYCSIMSVDRLLDWKQVFFIKCPSIDWLIAWLIDRLLNHCGSFLSHR